MRLLARILSFLLLAAMALTATARGAAPRWEEVNSAVEVTELRIDGNETVDIAMRDGYLYVSSRQPVTVKLYTILGQLIVQEHLQPGIFRFKLTTRGIYLLKAGNLTRRVTV